MARHAARRLFRLLPVLLIGGAAVVLVASVLIAACGGSSPGSAASQSATPSSVVSAPTTPSSSPSAMPTPTTIRVYFLRGEKLGVAQRQVPRTKAVAAAAMTALCGGPTAEERTAGLGSCVPTDTRLLGVSVKDGVATVDLSREYASGGGSLSMMARVAQVVYTLTQFPTVKSVDFKMDGASLETLGGEGIILEPGQTRSDWQDFEPPIFVESPGVGAVLTDPFILRGAAVVFEGSFMAQLTDSSGRRIVRTPVQASMGAPERGTFAKTIAYSTAAKSGWLVVYDVSMKDGSRLDVVKIPVTFGD